MCGGDLARQVRNGSNIDNPHLPSSEMRYPPGLLRNAPPNIETKTQPIKIPSKYHQSDKS